MQINLTIIARKTPPVDSEKVHVYGRVEREEVEIFKQRSASVLPQTMS